MVLEIPPAWQTALEDVGPAGVDKGKGGKYLILPPGYKDKVPDGYIALPSETYTGFVILRSNLESGSDADIAKAVTYGKRVKFYPLSQAANPPPTKFVDAIDVLFDSTIPCDVRFFETLDRFVQREPWLTRDKVMIDQLKTIGIEKGKPFQPDDKTRKILTDAAREAQAWLDLKYEGVFSPPFNEGTHWALPASPGAAVGLMTNFAQPDAYPVEGRGVAYSMAYFSAKHLGTGQFYLMTIVDKDGQALDGGSTYRLTVPANAPVKLYWSATAYDRATHALIRDLPWSSRASNTPALTKTANGSVDVYFGPKAPPGKESNWVPTKAGGQFEVLFRTRALPAGPDTRVKITEEYARHVARDSYFWGWPLVNVYNKRLAAAKSTQRSLTNYQPFSPMRRRCRAKRRATRRCTPCWRPRRTIRN